jgi:surfactin synthase thioesterase subunit
MRYRVVDWEKRKTKYNTKTTPGFHFFILRGQSQISGERF